MLKKWANGVVYRGYYVQAFTPSFSANIGYYPTTDGGTQPDMTNPYWGHGSGNFQVNYPNTSKDFWAQVQTTPPVALMSFSRGQLGVEWSFEPIGRNLQLTDWVVSQRYISNAGPAITDTFDPPIPGGAANDYSPEKGSGPSKGSPPDNSRPVNWSPETNLPTKTIIKKIKAKYTDPAQINPMVNPTKDAGKFVSEYMDYHVIWYRLYINAKYRTDAKQLPNYECKFSGHTHVGVNLSVPIAADAVQIQLDALIDLLPK